MCGISKNTINLPPTSTLTFRVTDRNYPDYAEETEYSEDDLDDFDYYEYYNLVDSDGDGACDAGRC